MTTEQIKMRLDTFVDILNGLPGIEVTSYHFDGVKQVDGSYVVIFLHAFESNHDGLFLPWITLKMHLLLNTYGCS